MYSKGYKQKLTSTSYRVSQLQQVKCTGQKLLIEYTMHKMNIKKSQFTIGNTVVELYHTWLKAYMEQTKEMLHKMHF